MKKKYRSSFFLFLISVCLCLLLTRRSCVTKTTFVNIPSGSDYNQVKSVLNQHDIDLFWFDILARLRRYPTRIKAGRYKLDKGMHPWAVLNKLYLAKQDPVRLTISNFSQFGDFLKRSEDILETDSLSLARAFFLNPWIKEQGFDSESIKSILLPDTYHVYWNDAPKKIVQNLVKEYQKFWTTKRKEQAKKEGLTPYNVVVLASIVEKETAKNDEKARVAGLYLNRLRKGWKLQADPTLVYAYKKQHGFDKNIQRVLFEDLKINSAYNTYQHMGLPPAPICVVSKSSIEAVLKPELHDYFFMCASTERIGYHEFSKTYEQHKIYGREYSKMLNEKKIYR